MIIQASAALRVFSLNLSCADITGAFTTQPDSFYNKGDRISKQNKSSKLQSMSMWQLVEEGSLNAGDGSMLLERCIEQLLDRVQLFESQLNILPDCEKDISCGLFSNNEQVNVYLGRKVMRRLARLEVDLILSGYAST